MNFYIDFEANQFSDRIISIGCISENGNNFYSLCRPSKPGETITNFITDLTGITKEDMAQAPSADEAFNLFFDWIISNNNNTRPYYYCYGDNDKNFIESTVKYMKNTRAISFALSIMASMIDYSSVVKKFFNSNSSIGLNRIYSFLQEETEPQKHNSLEDAKMLQYVIKNFDKCCPDDITKLPASSHTHKAETPSLYRSWIQGKGQAYKANTLANEENYAIKAFNPITNQTKYFDSTHTAVLWLFRYFANSSGLSVKKPDDVLKITNRLNSAINSKHHFYGIYWTTNGD